MISDIFWANPIRDLKFANWRQPQRPATEYITIHYNGPPVPSAGNAAGEREQLRFDATYHMRPNVLNADGIQYHIAILSSGERVKLRGLNDRLWHCGNARGNQYSVAIHVPIGGMQIPTAAQKDSLRKTIDTLRNEYDIHQLNVKPHLEWKATECPGVPLMAFIGAFRIETMHGVPYQLFVTTDTANVRSRADVRSPVQYTLPKNTTVAIGAVVENGVPFNGNSAYAQLSDGSGFIHLSIMRAKGLKL